MTKERPIGVWRALFAIADYKVREALWPEVVLALLIGGGGSALLLRATTVDQRVDAIGDVLTLAGAFLAVVFAALAIVVSLPSKTYLRMLEETRPGGMRLFLDPFLVAAGTQIFLILSAIAYTLAAADLGATFEHAIFYVVGFAFVFGLLDIAGLARQLARHGILRAQDALIKDEANTDAGSSVRRLPSQRKSRS